MPGPYGLTPAGFVAKPAADIRADLEARFRTTFGNGIDLSANSVFGELIGIFSDRLADTWQLAQAVYTEAMPDSADGASLDLICGITGTVRHPPTKTIVTVTCYGTPGTVLLAGRVVSVLGVGAKFQSVADATIGAMGSIDVIFNAQDFGPKTAPALTLTVIETPVAGWIGCQNSLDQSVLGTNAETDAALKLRREFSLRAIGGASSAAIEARVREIAGVTSARVFANETDSVDANGVPGHAFECVVNGGLAQAIVDAIYSVKPVGVATYGNASGVESGGHHTIYYSRPANLLCYVTINVTVSGSAPSNVGALIASAVAAFGALTYTVGSSLVSSALVPSIFTAAQGVTDVQPPLIGTAPSPLSSATIPATNRQLVSLDTTRIVVNVTRA